MQFQVPQFINLEDKLIGPLSLKQFLIIAGAAGVSALLYLFLQFFVWAVFSVLIVGGTAVLIIAKPYGQPLGRLVLAAIKYMWNPQRYIWQKEAAEETRNELGAEEKIRALAKRLLMRK